MGGLIDWCRAQVLPRGRYIRLQRSKYHYETHPRVPQLRKGQNTNGALARFRLVRYGQRRRKLPALIIPVNTECKLGKKYTESGQGDKEKTMKGRKKNKITCFLRTRRDLCRALRRDGLCIVGCCWILVVLLKMGTSMPGYGNSWPPVGPPKLLSGILSRRHPLITELPS